MMSRHEEKISFHPLVQILYVALLVFFFWSAIHTARRTTDVLILVLVGLILVALPLLFGRLIVVVDERELRATWGHLGWPRKVIPLAIIEKSETITYRPLRQFGGWGIRCGRLDGEWTACYTLRGNRGLLLSLSEEVRANFVKTRKFLLGSQQPERLHQALGR